MHCVVTFAHFAPKKEFQKIQEKKKSMGDGVICLPHAYSVQGQQTGCI